MKKSFRSYFASRMIHSSFSIVLGAALCLVCAVPGAAQKKKKNQTPQSDDKLVLPMGDEQQIDYVISEMLGAWQIGDTDRMHKDYADDVMVVNGIWAPPVMGWQNYLSAYQQQHARMKQIRMDRSNTYIKFFEGKFAWACYQWDFSALVDGQPAEARGQTTLIFEKRDNHWLIVHNHTSVAQAAEGVPPRNTPQIIQPPGNGAAGH
ncbi:MAG TPA: nuclear transport factor 2 family protein [Candidatus Acidoferrum sp.]|nr:nuclear transport factor 2 family protein [Candidatus Acidoferrum sp.]